MAESVYPKSVIAVVTTLADLFRHQGRTELCEIMELAHASFDVTDYESWNGGTNIWTLRLEIPVPLFVTLESRLPQVEKEIVAKLSHFDRQFSNDRLNSVTITPLDPAAGAVGLRTAVPDAAVRRLWGEPGLRLFVSHVAEHKVAVAKLKEELAKRGVAAFVAHDDIEPSREWQTEIELALRSAQALTALITPDFHTSKWTDQEVGWALGRGLLVLPVRLDANPYGFMGKVQGGPGRLDQADALADMIVTALLANPQTHGEMRRALATAMCGAKSFAMAKALRNYVVQVTDFTDEEKLALRNACGENSQIAGAFGVPESIYRIVGRPPVPPVAAALDEEVPF